MTISKILIITLFLGGLLIALLIWHSSDRSNQSISYRAANQYMLSDANTKVLNIPPRRMWGWSFATDPASGESTVYGYCGETSIQSAMIYYGNYISAEQVYKAGKDTIIVGDNDTTACKALQLTYGKVTGLSIPNLLNYIKSEIDLGHPLMMGFYLSETGGDPDYDHIMPIIGYHTDGSGGTVDAIYYYDLYQMRILTMDCSIDPNTKLPVCAKTRNSKANWMNVDTAQPNYYAIPNVSKFSYYLSMQGNVNPDPSTPVFPCMLTMVQSPGITMTPEMEPDWGIEDSFIQNGKVTPLATPCPISCQVLISQLVAGNKYSLLRFDNPTDIPTKGSFIDSGTYTMRLDFTSLGDTKTVDVSDSSYGYPFRSDGTYFFRCVNYATGVPSKWPPGTDRTDHKQGVLTTSTPNGKLADLKTKIKKRLNSIQSYRIGTTQISTDSCPVPTSGLDAEIQCCSQSSCNNCVGGQGLCGSLSPIDDSTCAQGTCTGTCVKTCTKPGSIHRLWKWSFPNTPAIGCCTCTFTTPPASSGSEADNCILFSISSEDSVVKDEINTYCTGAVMGEDKRIYIMDYAPSSMSFQLGCYSMGPPVNGVYTMQSEDGATVSYLTPI